MKTIAIIIQGGIIQGVVSDNPELLSDLNIKVIDYDRDACVSDDDVQEVPQGFGIESEPAYISEHTVSKSGLPVTLDTL